jgi:hypothetical protein
MFKCRFLDRFATMDRVPEFAKGRTVEALDCAAGVWRGAVVALITPKTVSFHYPEFGANKNRGYECISDDVVDRPSCWPIRQVTADRPAPPESTERPQRDRKPDITKLGDEKASRLIIGDYVSPAEPRSSILLILKHLGLLPKAGP